MRLDTAEKRAAYRKAMIPDGAVLDPRSNERGEVYAYERAGKVYAVAFWGTAGKPTWHYSFRSPESREAKVAGFFDSLTASSERKAKAKAERAAFVHDVKVGDIFRSSWGYDQTNIDYYQCVRLVGSRMMEVREIQQQSASTGWLQGDCVPAPGVWATEAVYGDEGEAYKAQHGHYPHKDKPAFRVLIQSAGGGEPCFRVASYACAYRIKPLVEIAGAKVYRASHWTAYH